MGCVSTKYISHQQHHELENKTTLKLRSNSIISADGAAILYEMQSKGSSRVELSVRGFNLVDLGVYTKSGKYFRVNITWTTNSVDPMVIVYFANSKNNWEELGRSEVVLGSNSPLFCTLFKVLI